MKKFLSFLTAIAIIVSTTTSMIACQTKEEEINTENVHEKIKVALSEPLEFNDDWIIDYDHYLGNNIKNFVYLLTQSDNWTYLTKTVSYLVMQRLNKKLPNLLKLFPDFTLFTTIVAEDEEKLRDDLLNNRQAKFHYNFYYNFHQLQNIDFSTLIDWEKGRGMLEYYDFYVPGEYSLIYKDGYKNEINFNQKNLLLIISYELIIYPLF